MGAVTEWVDTLDNCSAGARTIAGIARSTIIIGVRVDRNVGTETYVVGNGAGFAFAITGGATTDPVHTVVGEALVSCTASCSIGTAGNAGAT